MVEKTELTERNLPFRNALFHIYLKEHKLYFHVMAHRHTIEVTIQQDEQSIRDRYGEYEDMFAQTEFEISVNCTRDCEIAKKNFNVVLVGWHWKLVVCNN